MPIRTRYHRDKNQGKSRSAESQRPRDMGLQAKGPRPGVGVTEQSLDVLDPPVREMQRGSRENPSKPTAPMQEIRRRTKPRRHTKT